MAEDRITPEQPYMAAAKDLSIDMLLDLVEAGLSGDFNRVRRLARSAISNLSGDEGSVARTRLEVLLGTRGRKFGTPVKLEVGPIGAGLLEIAPWPAEPALLENEQAEILDRFEREVQEADRLFAAGLATRSNLLLAGPPGTGKTTIAGQLAARLERPFAVARLDALISSLLGDTAKNIRTLFNSVKDSGGFLFLDEVDAIAKFREDSRDVGELKRVVNTFIQALDALPYGCVVVAATNHPQLLDPAIWRRFPYQIQLALPNVDLRERLWRHHLAISETSKLSSALAKLSEGLSGSDIREISLSARRMALLDNHPLDAESLADAALRCAPTRLAMPRRLDADARAELRIALQKRDFLSPTDRATLKGISLQAESDYTARRAPLRVEHGKDKNPRRESARKRSAK